MAADGALPAFTAGAHIDVTLGNGIERSYSLLNDPTETHRYVIAVLREVESRGGSTWVHDHLREGDRLVELRADQQLPAQRGRREPHPDRRRHRHYAAEVDGAPADGDRRATFTLHYCARDRERAAYLDELTASLGERLQRASRRRRSVARARRGGAAVKAAVRGACLCLRAGRPDPRRARGRARLAEGHRPLRAVPRVGGDVAPRSTDQAVRDHARARRQDADGAGRQVDPRGAAGATASRSRRCARRASAAPAASGSSPARPTIATRC